MHDCTRAQAQRNKTSPMISRRRSGTSLVEILVVIVVFLVGILAVVQIFPGGFGILRSTANNSIATALGRAEIEMLKSHADQLPDAIVPVSYINSGGQINLVVNPDRYPNDLGPGPYGAMDNQGNLYDSASNLIADWQYLVGSNIMRHVFGEGKIIPAPRQVGNFYGSLLTLQFAPLLFNPSYNSQVLVYGNDLARREGDPLAQGFGVRPTEFWVANEDNAQAEIFFAVNQSRQIRYRVSLTAYVTGVGRQDLVTVNPVVINPGNSGQVSVATIFNLPSVDGIEYDSVKVERVFEDVSALPAADWGGGGPNPDPYEYKLVSQQRGLVLFNPAGYNYFIRRGTRRDPLVGRVDYDVFDWRIIHDEFVVPSTVPYQYKVAIGSMKVTLEAGPDGALNQGIGVQAPDSTGTLRNADLVVEDADTGGLVVFQEQTADPTMTSFTVNKSTGVITFLDADPARAGLQLMEVLPGQSTPTNVTVDNRTLRALYMGKNEWAVQVLKPAAVFQESWTRPGATNFYLGGSAGGPGATDRIYFPPACAGRMVSIGELYYVNSQGIEVGPVPLTAKVSTSLMDSTWTAGGYPQLPFIRVTDYFPDFAGFDYAYTAAVKDVKGASVAVRVLWNPNAFGLLPNATANMNHLETWMQGWRRSTVETYLQRGY